MRAVVEAAWLKFTGDIEGGDAAPVIYQDIRGKVTAPYGILCDSASAVAAMPMQHPDGRPATDAEKVAAFYSVKNDPSAARLGWRHAAKLSDLRFSVESMHRLAMRKLHDNERVLRSKLPDWDDLGACVQMALSSLAWGAGPNAHYPRMYEAIKARDFARMAIQIRNGVPGEVVAGGAALEIHMNERTPEGKFNAGLVPRNIANKILLRNAQRVHDFHLDPDTLDWTHVLGVADAPTLRELPNAASSPTIYPGPPSEEETGSGGVVHLLGYPDGSDPDDEA